MIYGSFLFQASDTSVSANLASAIKWQSSIHFEISYGQFSGGIFTDVRLPQNLDDFYCIDAENECLLLFCGSIYNLPETTPKLISAEDLMMQYKKQGSAFVEKLNGDFSIVVYHKKNEQVFLFRDHVGIMPLAYNIDGLNLHFSSDILNLCRVLHKKNEPVNLEALLDGFKLVNYEQTPNPKVKKVLPGHYLSYKNKEQALTRYWFPENTKTQQHITQKQAEEQLHGLILEAVKIRSNEDLMAASHLSGGLDSGLITALAKINHPKQVDFYGFSWSPENQNAQTLEFDERKRVKDCAEKIGIENIFVPGSPETYLHHENGYFPNSNSFEEDFVLDFAKNKGIQVLFSGWGGDDFASIGHKGVESDLFFAGKWLKLFQNKQKKTFRKKAAHLLYTVIYPYFGRYKSSMKKYFQQNTKYLNAAFQQQDKLFAGSVYLYRSRKERHLNALKDGHLATRCEMWYNIAVRQGILYRYPLLDKNIIEFMLSLPSSVLYDTEIDRKLFRSVSKHYLPESVCKHQRKTDPVLNTFSQEYYEICFRQFVQNFSDLKRNPELNCFNFDLLEADLNLYEQGILAPAKKEALFNTVFNLYNMDLFIASYKKI